MTDKLSMTSLLAPLASNDLLSGARHYLCVRTNRFFARSDTNRLHSAGSRSINCTNQKVSKHIFVEIEFAFDRCGNRISARHSRDIFWVEDAEQPLTANGPQPNARCAIVNR